MKKINLLVLLIITFIFNIFPMHSYADFYLPSHIRIGLFYGNIAENTIVLTSTVGFNIGKYNERTFIKESSTDTNSIKVAINGVGKINVYDTRNGTEICNNVDNIGIVPNASGMEQVFNINGTEYRGGVDIILSNGSLTVVNVVFLDHYLYGVISREMSPSWHIEALKAQAVCARNYAVQNIDKHSSQGFDLCANVHCQAYSGTSFETEKSYAPVDETTRQVLTYDGELAKLFYSSSMGPTTEDVQNVWGNSLPYLVSVDNSYEDTENIPNGVWSGTITADEASAIMKNKGYDVGDVTNIEVMETTESGRVLHLKVTGTEGYKIFDRESCRLVFNSVTKSQMFTVVGDGVAGKRVPKIKVTDGVNTSNPAISKIILLTSAGRKTLESNILYATNGAIQEKYEIVESSGGINENFYFKGVGWGHGVGMSQYGAKGMAEAGYDYLSILQHYFLDTNLENAY